jgi:ABC-2 type transport system permease protein
MMRSVLAIAARDLRASFTSPVAYVALTIFLLAANGIFFRGFFLIGQADLRFLFDLLPWLFLLFVPAIAMGAWAEERRQGTLELLLTLPVRNADLALGKFLARLALLAIALLLTAPTALSVSLLGPLDWGPVAGGYAGLLFLGAADLSLGLAISALTRSQIVAFLAAFAGCFVMLLLGAPFLAAGSQGVTAQLLGYLGLGTHFASISRGVIDSRDVVYNLTFIGICLYLNAKALGLRGRR